MNTPAKVNFAEPPNRQPSEAFVLGELLCDGDSFFVIEGILTAEMFFTQEHRDIFSALIKNRKAGIGTDPVTIAEQVPEVGVSRLVEFVTDAQHPGMDLKTHAMAVRDAHSIRQLIVAARSSLELCYQGASVSEVVEALQLATASADTASQSGGRKTAHMLASYNATHQQIIDERMEGKTTPGIKTGITDIDNKIVQCNAGWLFVIGASPGTGKTALFLNFVNNLIMKNSATNALLFSVEMPIEDIYDRALALQARVDLTSIRTGQLTKHERQLVSDAGFSYERTGVMVDDDGSVSVEEIRLRCRQYVRKHGPLHLIVVDYMQIVEASNKSEMRSTQVGNIATALKSIAKEFSAPVIALSQLARPPKTSPDREPVMSDLKESGAIEAAADIIVLMHKPREPTQGEDSVKLIIDKNRAGSKGSTWLHFDGAKMKFTSTAAPSAEQQYEYIT